MSPAQFWAKVERGDSRTCWLWTARRNGEGYGVARVNGIAGAHRVAWALTHGPIAAGLFVCHHCDTPRCCNPVHLFLGTVQDNNRDAWLKGRTIGGWAVVRAEDDEFTPWLRARTQHYRAWRLMGGTLATWEAESAAMRRRAKRHSARYAPHKDQLPLWVDPADQPDYGDLSPEQVEEIRARLRAHAGSASALAREMGIRRRIVDDLWWELRDEEESAA